MRVTVTFEKEKIILPLYFSFSYDIGLGVKNSQGFGMWEIQKQDPIYTYEV
jgi:CRISPR/Cas system endoribonuclease Cas6 (RAMP superfamily)